MWQPLWGSPWKACPDGRHGKCSLVGKGTERESTIWARSGATPHLPLIVFSQPVIDPCGDSQSLMGEKFCRSVRSGIEV